MTLKRIILIIVFSVFAIFIVQNAQVVQVKLLFWSTKASHALVLMITFILGLLAGRMSGWRFKKKK